MPFADVNDVLADTDVAGESFSVIRQIEAVNTLGRSVITAYQVDGIVGSVQPTGDNSMVRDEAYSIQAKTIEVFTQFRLRGVTQNNIGATSQPDIIVWGGSQFLVKSIDDWSQYGAGFIKAECAEFIYNGPPPLPGRTNAGRWDFSKRINSGLGGGARGNS